VAFTRATLEEATERTRRLMFELRPAILHEHGLAAAISILTEQTAKEVGARSQVHGSIGRHDPVIEELVYRSAQEALANVRKHASPHHVAVRFSETSTEIGCQIDDDGRGFDPDHIRTRPQAAFHQGLDALTERVRAAGGTITIETAPGRGTHVALTIPTIHPRYPT
jgi:signal transduction histidine kinase